jgi:ribosomal protein S18 acetylase RimI-like enzyme
MQYRLASEVDLAQLKQLAINGWARFEANLTPGNWATLLNNLSSDDTYLSLLQRGRCLVCEEGNSLIGMAFFIPSGHPDTVYQADWCQIRFVTVHPNYNGKGIGRKLTQWCIEQATLGNEHTIALHTSEMMGNARHIYESLGFSIAKELEPRLGKRYWLYKLDI